MNTTAAKEPDAMPEDIWKVERARVLGILNKIPCFAEYVELERSTRYSDSVGNTGRTRLLLLEHRKYSDRKIWLTTRDKGQFRHLISEIDVCATAPHPLQKSCSLETPDLAFNNTFMLYRLEWFLHKYDQQWKLWEREIEEKRQAGADINDFPHKDSHINWRTTSWNRDTALNASATS